MGQERYSPDFAVFIGEGKDQVPIPDALRRVIASVSFTTGLEGSDRVELVIANQALRWLDDKLLEVRVPPKDPVRFELHLGYTGALVPMFVGGITGVAASFPGSGVPQLTVTAQDARYQLQKGQQAKWHNKEEKSGNSPVSDADIVSTVAREHNLIGRYEPPGGKGLAQLVAAAAGLGGDPIADQKAVRQQVGESDYALLTRLAKQNGLELVIDYSEPNGGKKLRLFSPAEDQSVVAELEYMLSLIEFTPRESNVGQVDTVAANVWLPDQKKSVGVTLSADAATSALVVQVSDQPAKPDDRNGAVLLNEPLTPTSAPQRLVGELMPRLNQKLTGSGSTVGNPLITAGSVLRLTGLGTRFGGLYRVTSATHTLDTGGYKTRFDVRKELWFNVIPASVQKAQPVRRAPQLSAGG
jgi:phage protein D